MAASKGQRERKPSRFLPAPPPVRPLTPATWLLWPALLAVTIAAYYPALSGGLVWDDAAHVTAPGLRSTGGLWRIWFDLDARPQYYPVTHSVFWLMHRLWGDQTLGYHLVNVCLHATSAFLVAVLLRRLAVPGALLAGVLFAVHPVHVESVAWISELKNTLSGVLYLLAALAYLSFDQTRRLRTYVIALTLFVLALLSKTVVATLPAALLVVLWWKRGRLGIADLKPIAPMLALGIAAGLGTAWVERVYIGAEGAEFDLSVVERCLIAGRAVWFYASKLLWPFPLMFVYPRWEVSAGAAWQYLYPLSALAVVAGSWALRGRSRTPLAVALLFGGTLIPALGFVDVYPFRFSFVADHFQYLASIAPLALIAAAAVSALRRWAVPALALRLVIVALGLPLALLTWQQSHHYIDAETLYRSTLSENPACWMCHNNLALIEFEKQQHAEALAHLDASLRINPGVAEAHDNRGVMLRVLGRRDEALRAHEEAVRLAPQFAKAHYNLAGEYQAAGRHDAALEHYREAIRLDPGHGAAHENLGRLLAGMGRLTEALASYDRALHLDPASASARNDRGTVRLALGQIEQAVADYQGALDVDRANPRAHDNLAFALFRGGRAGEALVHAQEALRLDPAYMPARVTLGTILLNSGRPAEAIPHFREALARPAGVDVPQVHGDLGVALARVGQRDLAIRHFQEAIRLRPDFPEARANLARALGR